MPTIFAFLGAVAMAFCQWLIYAWTPQEATMGLMQKIFYLHLPLAWWAMVSFFLVFVGSAFYLARKNSGWDNFCVAAAEIGVLFSSLALASGIIWAKKSWGIWWTWDPRLSTTLVMWFIYASYLIIGHLDLPMRRKRIVRAVLGIVAFLDVPLVFISARIFRSIHPAVFASKSGGLESEMKFTVFACIVSLGLLWGAILMIRKRQLDQNLKIEQIIFNYPL